MINNYCIGVDVLNFPVSVIHTLPVEKLYFISPKIKESTIPLKFKHYNMQHK